MNRSLIENIVFLCVASLISLSQPAVRPAVAEDYHPINFTAPISLSRGTLAPIGEGEVTLNRDETCRFAMAEWGWLPETCKGVDQFVVVNSQGIDSMLVGLPTDDGFVKFDDWADSDRAINEIWNSFVQNSKDQGERIHKKITPLSWYVKPTLEKDKSYLYYAMLVDWNGEKLITVKATKFDRYGYVPFIITPLGTDITPVALQAIVEKTIQSYTPRPQASYSSYVSGDKVAAVGAVGVLATLVGVKYGKVAAAGAVAVGVILLKKLGFVLFILPVLLFKRIVRFFRGTPSA